MLFTVNKMAAQRRGKSTKNKFYSINWTWTDQYPVLPKVTKNIQFMKKHSFWGEALVTPRGKYKDEKTLSEK